MFNITWDTATGGVQLSTQVTKETLGISPRPVFYEELDLLGLDKLGWSYPRCQQPLLWAVNKQYYYRGQLVFEAKGANLYDAPTINFATGKEKLTLTPVDVAEMLRRNQDFMFLLESEAIEFIRDVFVQYSSASKSVERVKANQIDFEALREKMERRTRTKMAIVREDCDSFDIMPLDEANKQGKREYKATKIDRFIASFSGGKDSQVILDLCTRAIPSTDFEVIYSDTGYELPPSLELYDTVRKFYSERFPKLKFTLARNHESVLNYWDKIGTPSDTHRWCCTVMKTAPLYRMLKVEGTNQQAKVIAFEGVRAEESTRRSVYHRIGRGVKHDVAINARPILRWSTTEIFLYILNYQLPINPAYRQGITRVGCVICPYSSEWNEFVASRNYAEYLNPFTKKLERFADKAGVRDIQQYIKEGNWKRRASGNLVDTQTTIKFCQSSTSFSAIIENQSEDLLQWLKPLGRYSLFTSTSNQNGEINIKGKTYSFDLKFSKEKTTFTLFGCQDPVVIGLVKRALYKTAHCSHCEVCEVECPTGALSVIPTVNIDTALCIHCHKCLTFHDKGCIVANSLYQTSSSKMKSQSSIDRYKNFGLKEEWIEAFFLNPENFWESEHGLQKQYQVPALRNWLKDAEIIDGKFEVTPLGLHLAELYRDNPTLVWEVIWINLTYNSFIAQWYSARLSTNTPTSSKALEQLILNEFENYKEKTVHNAVYQILRTLKESSIGSNLCQCQAISKEQFQRVPYNELSIEAVAYSLYKYGQTKGINTFRVSDLYRPEEESGLYREFGISQEDLKKKLRALSSDSNRVLIAELNMGLDHITLRDDLTPLTALQQLLE